jgi:hypothetical protein
MSEHRNVIVLSVADGVAAAIVSTERLSRCRGVRAVVHRSSSEGGHMARDDDADS